MVMWVSQTAKRPFPQKVQPQSCLSIPLLTLPKRNPCLIMTKTPPNSQLTTLACFPTRPFSLNMPMPHSFTCSRVTSEEGMRTPSPSPADLFFVTITVLLTSQLAFPGIEGRSVGVVAERTTFIISKCCRFALMFNHPWKPFVSAIKNLDRGYFQGLMTRW